MKQFISKHLVALILCLFSPASFSEPASKIVAQYDVIGYGMTLANITETYTRTEDTYQIESTTKAAGFLAKLKPETIRITSKGKFTPQGLLPLNFSMTRVLDKEKNASATFNWEDSLLTLTDYKGVNTRPLPPGTQDRLSVMYHFPLLAKSEMTEFKFGIADGNDMKNYDFYIMPKDREITVPLGKFKTRYLTNTPVGDELKYEIWMATERDDFPCKFTITDAKGSKITQVLTGLTITP